ncbi:MAG: toll/interleukin-1 receptor domain-containing protein [Longimicrobiales bacterium]
MNAIFVSYRREDSAGHAGRLFDRLSEVFGKDSVFQDVDDLHAGDDFVQGIADAMAGCKACLVVIGRGWTESSNDSGERRLDEPGDFVRIEVETALKRGIVTIPVLVQGATMPKASDLPQSIRALTRRQAVELSDSRWDFDAGQLIDQLGLVLGVKKPRARRLDWRIAVGVSILVVAGLGASQLWQDRGPATDSAAVALLPLTYGTWTLHSARDSVGTDWSNSTLQFTSAQPTPDGLSVTGVFEWREFNVLVGTETFRGNYHAATRTLVFEGKELSDSVKLAFGSYSARLSEDGRSLLDGRFGTRSQQSLPGYGGHWEANR